MEDHASAKRSAAEAHLQAITGNLKQLDLEQPDSRRSTRLRPARHSFPKSAQEKRKLAAIMQIEVFPLLPSWPSRAHSRKSHQRLLSVTDASRLTA
jgi:hypothetical protein